MSEQKIKTALFDFDGVVADTEPIYDQFWSDMGIRYQLGIDNFSKVIKGLILPVIMERFFSQFSEETRQSIVQANVDFERTMPIPPLPGSLEFIHALKAHGVKMGLVTSSSEAKIQRALKLLQLEGTFDTLISADRITKGKPDPMCFLLAAKDLAAEPEDCLVFEDSLNGIRAGVNAGMRVIGLSTTNPEEVLREMVYKVIPNFQGLTFEDYKRW